MGLFYRSRNIRAYLAGLGILLLSLFSQLAASAQSGLVVNLAPLDGIALTPENIFSYTLQSNMSAATEARIRGSVRYRQSGLSFSYTFHTRLTPGLNRIDPGTIHPEWSFSGSALRELFQDYHILPQGTYEYCVTVTPTSGTGEIIDGQEMTECLYSKADDLFLINLVDPENNAKLHEFYPVFSWIVNYPFASQLTYRIRVAEIKEGQNAANAVVRNNPVYTESNLPQTTTTYPVYGTPLKAFQPYAWTVDAFYKGILLGGAEPWKFTIIEDSLMIGIPRESAFVDIRQEQNSAIYYAVGNVKLKYILDEKPDETLGIRLLDEKGRQVKIKEESMTVKLGDNRREINLKDQVRLRHLGRYVLEIVNSSNNVYQLPIRYVNPDFL
jgi:hypothetical protein